jgi:ABC-type polysaccharide/polyol phosphate transport system ATPase subunit
MLSCATTLLLVSHDSGMIERLCDKALWLRKGEAVLSGSVKEVCAAYAEYYE